MDKEVIDRISIRDYQGAINLLQPNLQNIIDQPEGRQSDDYYIVMNLYLTLAIGIGMVEVKDVCLRELEYNLEPEEMEIRLFLNKCLLEISFLEADYSSSIVYGDFLLENLDEYFDIIEGTDDGDDIMSQYKALMYNYAKILLEEKDLERASDVLDLVISIEDVEDDFPQEYYYEKKATVLAMQGQTQEAIEFLISNLIEETPDSIIALRKISVLYLNEKNFDLAQEYLDKCLSILMAYGDLSTCYVIYADLASLFHEKGDEVAALEAEQQVISQNPHYVNMSSEAFATAGVTWTDMDYFTLTVFARLQSIQNGEYVYKLNTNAHIIATYTVHGNDELLGSNTYDYRPARVVQFQSPSFADVEEGTWIRVKYEIYDSAENKKFISSFYQLVKKSQPPIEHSCGHDHGDHGHSHGDHGDHGHSHGDHGHPHGDHGQVDHGDHGHSHGDHGQVDHGDHGEHGHSHGDHGHSHGNHGHSHGDHGHSH